MGVLRIFDLFLVCWYLDCSHLLAIMHSASVVNCLQVFVWAYVFIFLDCIPWRWIVDQMVSLWLAFWEAIKIFSKVAAQFCISTKNVWVFQFFYHSTPSCLFLYFKCEVVWHYGLQLWKIKYFLICLLTFSTYFLWINYIKILCLLF